MRRLRAPTVSPGDPIAAATFNAMAAAVNGELVAPRDLDQGGEGQGRRITVPEIERTSVTVRVENPDDPTQYVDVDRATISVLRNSDTGDEYEIPWLNE